MAFISHEVLRNQLHVVALTRFEIEPTI